MIEVLNDENKKDFESLFNKSLKKHNFDNLLNCDIQKHIILYKEGKHYVGFLAGYIHSDNIFPDKLSFI